MPRATSRRRTPTTTAQDNANDAYVEGTLARTSTGGIFRQAVSPTYGTTWQTTGLLPAPFFGTLSLWDSNDTHAVQDGYDYQVLVGVKESAYFFGVVARYSVN